MLWLRKTAKEKNNNTPRTRSLSLFSSHPFFADLPCFKSVSIMCTSCGNSLFQLELKKWQCTTISITSSILDAQEKITYGVNIPRSVSQVCETIYTSTELTCIKTTCKTSCGSILCRFVSLSSPLSCSLTITLFLSQHSLIKELVNSFREFSNILGKN